MRRWKLRLFVDQEVGGAGEVPNELRASRVGQVKSRHGFGHVPQPRIARHLVENGMAACVNIIPQVASIYRWLGKVEEAREWLLIVKTTAAAFEKVCLAIAELHSYELPECICLIIDDGSPRYLRWIAESVSAEKSGE